MEQPKKEDKMVENKLVVPAATVAVAKPAIDSSNGTGTCTNQGYAADPRTILRCRGVWVDWLQARGGIGL